MTTYNKTTLKTFFETGDVPGGTDYGNLIDSCVNMVETALQTINGPIQPTKLIAPRVSATNVNVTGILSANTFNTSNLSIGGTLTANGINATSYSGTTLSLSGAVSAARLNVTGDVSAVNGTVYASSMRVTNGTYRPFSVISAAGTTQATSTALGAGNYNLKGIVDGVTTGFTLLANVAGLSQTLFVAENTSCNLWPFNTDGRINGLTSGSPFPMAGLTSYIVSHVGASAYAVK